VQRIIAAFVQLMDVVTVEAFISNLHPRAERADGGKILDSEADSIRGSGEATIIERLALATLAFWYE
jgi:hypothetical protein